jgi:hypothetical protein
MVALAAVDAKSQVLVMIEPGRFFPGNGNFLVRCFQAGGLGGGSGFDANGGAND